MLHVIRQKMLVSFILMTFQAIFEIFKFLLECIFLLKPLLKINQLFFAHWSADFDFASSEVHDDIVGMRQWFLKAGDALKLAPFQFHFPVGLVMAHGLKPLVVGLLVGQFSIGKELRQQLLREGVALGSCDGKGAHDSLCHGHGDLLPSFTLIAR
jgi:hypothetical protein